MAKTNRESRRKKASAISLNSGIDEYALEERFKCSGRNYDLELAIIKADAKAGY
jgi:hypothetical protein